MSNVERLESLFIEGGPEVLSSPEVQSLVGADPECAAIVAALGELDEMWAQLAVPQEPSVGCGVRAQELVPTAGPNAKPITPLEWKPAAGEQLSTLVREEIENEAVHGEGQDRELSTDTSQAAFVPTLNDAMSHWTLPSPKRRFKMKHMMMGIAGSSMLSVAAVGFALHLSHGWWRGETAPIPSPKDVDHSDTVEPTTPAPPVAPDPVSTPSSDKPVVAPFRTSPRRSNGKKVGTQSPSKVKLTMIGVITGVKAHGRKVGPCLRSARDNGELPPGKYTFILNWVIKPDGSVRDPRLTGPPSVLDTSLPACFARVMLTWRFPESESDAPVRNFPLGPIVVK